MGLRDKYKKTDNVSFNALELNEMNVQSIFKNCLSTNKVPKAGIDLIATLFDTAGGYKTDYQTICFNMQKIKENKNTIKYLFGQLNSVHLGEKQISPENSLINYSNRPWTNNNRNINGIPLFS